MHLAHNPEMGKNSCVRLLPDNIFIFRFSRGRFGRSRIKRLAHGRRYLGVDFSYMALIFGCTGFGWSLNPGWFPEKYF